MAARSCPCFVTLTIYFRYAGILIVAFFYTGETVAQAPVFQPYQPIHPTKSPTYNPQPNPILRNDPYARQNQQLLQNSMMTLPGPQNTKAQKQAAYSEALAELKAEERNAEKEQYLAKAALYRYNYNQLIRLNPDSFSLAKAVYLSEAAAYKPPGSFESFQKAIKRTADGMRQYLKAHGLDPKNNTAINYALMQFFGKPGTFKDPKTGKMMVTQPFRYDFEDFVGDKDINQHAVAKLLRTGKGQCHSLPLLYLLLCEELGGKAYLVKTPEHSFVRFYDGKGTAWNFETTSGQLITDAFYVQSGYMSTAALKNGVYMDTLSRRQLLSSAITDLVNTYLHNLDYDDFSVQANETSLQLDPKNLQALMNKANLQTLICKQLLQQAGNPKPEELRRYPQLQNELALRNGLYKQQDNLGWQLMPPAMYKSWLQSMKLAQQQEKAAALRQKMQQEINYLKNIKIKIINAKPQ